MEKNIFETSIDAERERKKGILIGYKDATLLNGMTNEQKGLIFGLLVDHFFNGEPVNYDELPSGWERAVLMNLIESETHNYIRWEQKCKTNAQNKIKGTKAKISKLAKKKASGDEITENDIDEVIKLENLPFQ